MIVFDASALIAYVGGEAGADLVREHLAQGGAVSAANWSETAQKLGAAGVWAVARSLLLSFPLEIEPVTIGDAEAAAALWSRGSGLSLGDRLCLALSARLGVDALSADSAWFELPGVVPVRRD